MSSNPAPPKKSNGFGAEPFVFASPSGEQAALLGGGAAWKGPARTVTAAPPGELQAYERGLTDGEARARTAFEKALDGARSEIAQSLRQFALERESYFGRVETDVVYLALSIARKILHREAQIDPLLLTGIVRVALETLNEGTRVRLRTPPQEILFWRDYFCRDGQMSPAPELIGDASLGSGRCVLETEVGSTHISLDTQLKEIEQGFLDLLEQRPSARE